MTDYLGALIAHEWDRVCSLYTARLAARERWQNARSCPESLSRAAGGPGSSIANDPQAHPERAGDHLARAKVTTVHFLDRRRAQVWVDQYGVGEADTMLLVVRERGAWRLANGISLGVPIEPAPPAGSAPPFPSDAMPS